MNDIKSLLDIDPILSQFEDLLDEIKELENNSIFTLSEIFKFLDCGIEIDDLIRFNELLTRTNLISQKVVDFSEKSDCNTLDILINIKNILNEPELFTKIDGFIDKFTSQGSNRIFDQYVNNLRGFVLDSISGK